jgi:DNA invertase Pin-like site-specific DNA recombinase
MPKNVIGYARVSTKIQDLEAQKDRIAKYILENNYNSIEPIITDKITGVSGTRPGRDRIFKLAEQKKIEMVLCTRVDRWGRSLKDLVNSIQILSDHGVVINFIEQGLIIGDKSNPVSVLQWQLFGIIAEFERALIVERTAEGRQRAILYGTRSGKPMHRPIKELPVKSIITEYKSGASINKLAEKYKVNTATIKNRLLGANVKIRSWLVEVNT